ncbi:MAG: peptide chain release factor 3, partial [Burkholderiales bacterium]
YGVEARLAPSRFRLARWITSDDPSALKRFIDANAHRIAHDEVDAPALLVSHPAELAVIEERSPEIRFHALREHAGLVFQSRLRA